MMALIGVGVGLAGGIGVAAVHDRIPVSVERNGPVDPIVNEAIAQARGLQKSGKLEQAATVFTTYAQQGYPVAMFHAAIAYANGWGLGRDLDKARQLLLRAVQYSFDYRGEAAYELGRLYQRSFGPDCNRIAVEWFHRALDWQYAKAHIRLARHYERGIGVEADIERSLHHYRQAIELGFESAAISFARTLLKGRFGVEADPAGADALAERAIASLRLKAARGIGTAAKLLGRLYRDGEFVDRDFAEARRWFERAAELKVAGGMHDLAHLLLDKFKVKKREREALAWLRRAAAIGHGGSMTALGRFHLTEKYGLARSGAVDWLKRGVDAGHPGAMEELARLRAEGQLVEQDTDLAIRLAEQGARKGHEGSKSLLRKLRAQTKKTPANG